LAFAGRSKNKRFFLGVTPLPFAAFRLATFFLFKGTQAPTPARDKFLETLLATAEGCVPIAIRVLFGKGFCVWSFDSLHGFNPNLFWAFYQWTKREKKRFSLWGTDKYCYFCNPISSIMILE